MGLQKLMDDLAQWENFSENTYPELAKLAVNEDDDQKTQDRKARERQNFLLQLILNQQIQCLGELAAAVNETKQGRILDLAAVRKIAGKLLKNNLKLAKSLGMSAKCLYEIADPVGGAHRKHNAHRPPRHRKVH